MIVKDEKYYEWVDEVDPNCELSELELELMYRLENSISTVEINEDNN